MLGKHEILTQCCFYIAHRLRRWPKIELILDHILARAGWGPKLNQWWCQNESMGYPEPGNKRHWPNEGLMLGQRLRRWPNIKPVSDPGLNPAVSLTIPAPQSVLTLIRRQGPEIADYLHRELGWHRALLLDHPQTGPAVSVTGSSLWSCPSKHETLTQCWFSVGPPSSTSAQHWTNKRSTSRVCWDSSTLLPAPLLNPTAWHYSLALFLNPTL